MAYERERKKMANLMNDNSCIDDQQLVEPDWSKFEAVYAKDLQPVQEAIRKSPKTDTSEEKKQKCSSRTDQTRHQVTDNGCPPPVKDCPDKANRRIAPSASDGRHKKQCCCCHDNSFPMPPCSNISASDETERTVRVAGQKQQLNGERDNRTALQSSPQTREAQVKTSSFLFAVVDILLDFIRKTNDRSTKVLDFHHPHVLREMMSHCLDITDQPQNLEQILSDCKETLKYCVRTGHPRFFNQITCGLDMVALAGEWLTATANANMFTYEIAPVFILMEDVVLTKMRKCLGWVNGDGDGIFAPGGAISNLYAAMVARHKIMPESKAKGLCGAQRLVMFASDQSHYSTKRAGAILGIGTDNVIYVKSDERGKMIPSELERQIEKAKAEGGRPFFVTATAGTTVLGSFDPINEIADVCERHKIWLHVDGAWGGGLLLSRKHRCRLDGIHRANSVTWNPHKLMGTLLQCSAILIKEKGLLQACNSSNASYLFQQDKFYDVSYDTGDKAIQCGRHNDVFKLWLVWRAKGELGFEKQIDRLMDMSKYLLKRVSEREGFEMVILNPEFLNVCFWYVPKNLRHLPHNKERDEKLHKVAPKIKGKMMERGTTMCGYQPAGSKPNFFRMIVNNPASTTQDLDFLVAEIEKLGEEI